MDLGDFIHHGGAGQKLSKIFWITGATGFAVPSQAVKSAGSRSNPDGLFCAGITQLRTWLNSPPWLWLPETYCTLHNWYPIGKCLVLGSRCVLVPEERHQSPATCRKVLLCLFPKLLPFSWSHSPDSAGGLQREAGLPGVGVWYTQVGSQASTRSLAKNAAKACGPRDSG